MPLRIGRARTALNGVLDHSSTQAIANRVSGQSQVWITDDLLHEAVERFWRIGPHATHCRRHGSTVPGPLEARRRLAKRRMNNLAVSGCDSSLTIDPVLLAQSWLGKLWNGQKPAGELEWMWRAPALPEQKAEPKKQPAELDSYARVNEFLDSLIVPEKKLAARKRDQEKKMFGGPQQELASISRKDFAQMLCDVETLADLDDLYRQIGSAPLDAPACSMLALERLLELGTSIDDILKFLDNSKLNAAYGQNLATAFHNCNFDPDQFSYAITLLERGIFLQLVSRSRLLGVAKAFPKAVSRSFESPCDDPAVLDALERICSCITASNICDHRYLEIFLDQYLRQFFTPSSDRMEAIVGTKVLKAAARNLCDTICSANRDFFQRTFAQAAMQHWRPATAVAHESLGGIATASNLQKLFDIFPGELVSFALVHMARSLSRKFSLANKSSQEVLVQEINDWLGEVRTLGPDWINGSVWIEIYDELAVHLEPANLHSHFELLSVTDRCRLVLRHWTRLDIEKSTLASERHSQKLLKEMMRKLEDNFVSHRDSENWTELQGRSEVCRIHLALLKALKASDVPYAKTFENLLGLALALKEDAVFHDMVVFGKKHLGIEVDVSQRHLVAEYVNTVAPHRAALAYRVFCADEGLYLSYCPELVSSCIAQIGHQLHPWSILSLYEEPDPLAKRYESGTRPSSIPWNFKSGGTRLATLSLAEEDGFPDDSAFTYRRIDEIHETALAFASSRRISDGTACQAVFRCWRLLRMRGNTSSLDSRITMAFVQAGITRRLLESPQRAQRRLKRDKSLSEIVPDQHIPRGVFEAIRAVVHRVDGPTCASRLETETEALIHQLKRQLGEQSVVVSREVVDHKAHSEQQAEQE